MYNVLEVLRESALLLALSSKHRYLRLHMVFTQSLPRFYFSCMCYLISHSPQKSFRKILKKEYCLLLCFGSLSCWKRWPSGKVSRKKGNRVDSKISATKNGAFMMPSKISTCVGPRLLMPAHTWTLIGCFTVGFIFAGSPILRKQSFPCCSIQTLDSSVKTTLSNCSFVVCSILQKSSRLMRFRSLTNWQ